MELKRIKDGQRTGRICTSSFHQLTHREPYTDNFEVFKWRIAPRFYSLPPVSVPDPWHFGVNPGLWLMDPDPGSGSCYFLLIIFEGTFTSFFKRDPDPDPYLWLMDPDPGGPKTCKSGSGFGSGSGTLPPVIDDILLAVFCQTWKECSVECWTSAAAAAVRGDRLRRIQWYGIMS